MIWPRVKEGMGAYLQDDVKHASAVKEKKGRPRRDCWTTSDNT